MGAVKKTDMQGNFGNALMKAVTKAKRRVTLSICGLGMLDETEVETIPNVGVIEADITNPEPEGKPETNGKVDIYQAVVDAKLSQNVHSAKETLTRYCNTGFDTSEKANDWFRLYRGWRDSDLDPKDAAEKANKGEIPK